MSINQYADFNFSENGLTVPHCGVSGFCTVPLQVVMVAADSGTHNGCQRHGSVTAFRALTGA